MVLYVILMRQKHYLLVIMCIGWWTHMNLVGSNSNNLEVIIRSKICCTIHHQIRRQVIWSSGALFCVLSDNIVMPSHCRTPGEKHGRSTQLEGLLYCFFRGLAGGLWTELTQWLARLLSPRLKGWLWWSLAQGFVRGLARLLPRRLWTGLTQYMAR